MLEHESKEILGRYNILISEGDRKSTGFERKAAEIDNLDHRGVAGRMIEFDGLMGLIIGGGGASLMAFDAVKQHGGKPANYCEIGSNPSVLKVKELTKHILTKKGVEKIAIIMNVVSNTRVDLVARGIVKGDSGGRSGAFQDRGRFSSSGSMGRGRVQDPFKMRGCPIVTGVFPLMRRLRWLLRE